MHISLWCRAFPKRCFIAQKTGSFLARVIALRSFRVLSTIALAEEEELELWALEDQFALQRLVPVEPVDAWQLAVTAAVAVPSVDRFHTAKDMLRK